MKDARPAAVASQAHAGALKRRRTRFGAAYDAADSIRGVAMLPKVLIVLLLLAIVVALFSAVFFLVKDPADRDHRRTLRALTWRVGLQVALILFLIVAFTRGWIQPHGFNERPAPTDR